MAKKRKLNVKNTALVVIVVILLILVIIFSVKLLLQFNRNKTTSNENRTSVNEVISTNKPESTNDTVVEETPEPTIEPTIDPETDSRFFDTDSLLIVANKSHKLPDGYVPSDLTYPEVEMRYNTWSMRNEASLALEEMFAAARNEGVYLVMGSGYRGEDFQRVLYEGYAANYGTEYADSISSRPGYSDHQTGLATDLCGQDSTYDLSQEFENTIEGQWLKDHAHEYGFIMRYPKGKDEITGYAYEPWHYRYVGVDTATAIYSIDEFYTFEEYFGISGGDYVD